MDDLRDVRLLSRSGVPPYTRSPIVALGGEPEAVSEEDQWLITQQAADRELQAWQTSRGRLLAEIDHLRQHLCSPHVQRAARAWEREIQALDRRLAGPAQTRYSPV